MMNIWLSILRCSVNVLPCSSSMNIKNIQEHWQCSLNIKNLYSLREQFEHIAICSQMFFKRELWVNKDNIREIAMFFNLRLKIPKKFTKQTSKRLFRTIFQHFSVNKWYSIVTDWLFDDSVKKIFFKIS